jgi:hypothetical protein
MERAIYQCFIEVNLFSSERCDLVDSYRQIHTPE